MGFELFFKCSPVLLTVTVGVLLGHGHTARSLLLELRQLLVPLGGVNFKRRCFRLDCRHCLLVSCLLALEGSLAHPFGGLQLGGAPSDGLLQRRRGFCPIGV